MGKVIICRLLRGAHAYAGSLSAALPVSIMLANIMFRNSLTRSETCFSHFRGSGNPDFFMNFAGFRVTLAVASLPGMTWNFVSELTGQHAISPGRTCSAPEIYPFD
jgi:hypothetical protein